MRFGSRFRGWVYPLEELVAVIPRVFSNNAAGAVGVVGLHYNSGRADVDKGAERDSVFIQSIFGLKGIPVSKRGNANKVIAEFELLSNDWLGHKLGADDWNWHNSWRAPGNGDRERSEKQRFGAYRHLTICIVSGNGQT